MFCGIKSSVLEVYFLYIQMQIYEYMCCDPDDYVEIE